MILNVMSTQGKLVLDFSSFIVTTTCTTFINSIKLDTTTCSLMLDTDKGNELMGIEPLIFNEYPYHNTEVIGIMGITKERLKGFLKEVDQINWMGTIG